MINYTGQQFGSYRLLRLLGKGSAADVYLAEQLFIKRLVAIKVLHIQIGEKERHAFLQEAQIIARLRHPHIIHVDDFDFWDQTPYLVMEYAPQGTLLSWYPRGMQLPFEQIIRHVKQIAPALDYAHEQRVIHRDIKPENILLNEEEDLLLSDFGIAVVRSAINPRSAHKVAGTPLYMAPEQIMNQPHPASDQYALGVMVYEWLCGKPPFTGQSQREVLHKHLTEEPPGLCEQLPTLPQAVEDTVFAALAKYPERRFVSAADFAAVLEEACFPTHLLTVPALALEPTASLPVRDCKGAGMTQRQLLLSETRDDQIVLGHISPFLSDQQTLPTGQLLVPACQPCLSQAICLVDQKSRLRSPSLMNGLIFGLIGALVVGPVSGVIVAQQASDEYLPLFVLLCVLFSGVLFGLLNGSMTEQWAKILPLEPLFWCRQRLWRNLIRGVMNGWLTGLLVVLYELALGHHHFITRFLEVFLLGAQTGLIFFLVAIFLDRLPRALRPRGIGGRSAIQLLCRSIKYLGIGLLCVLLIALLSIIVSALGV